ncbi:histamine H3 receptor-like [Spea bombifrons]|uniref:histamine H3 receptor-like n=1 Tax=Spea bombifrons TaxID=233779 RepID=UPI0023498105|nr:histamine H3 receptor-like [Spea bombifrons]
MRFSGGIKYFIILLISLVICLTVSGNLLVMLAFIVDKRLRTQSNFFLLNLAICDFFIGVFSTPLYLPYMLTGKWQFGRLVCKLWLVIDYMMCVASVFNIVLISYDRFLSVTKAVLYRSQQNSHRSTVIKMGSVWVLSFLLYGPAIIFWGSIYGQNDISDTLCAAGFYEVWYFNFGTSIIDFALPLFSISYFNLSIYWNIKKRNRKKRCPSGPHHLKENQKRPYIVATNAVLTSTPLHKEKEVLAGVRSRVKTFSIHCFYSKKISSVPPADSQTNTHNIQTIKLSRDKKVAKALSVLVCVFAICWAPYTFVISIGKACNGQCVEPYWYEITVWMLYINSAINPILYPLCHKSFKNAFNIILQMFLKAFRCMK